MNIAELITIDNALSYNNSSEKLSFLCEISGLRVDNPKL